MLTKKFSVVGENTAVRRENNFKNSCKTLVLGCCCVEAMMIQHSHPQSLHKEALIALVPIIYYLQNLGH